MCFILAGYRRGLFLNATNFYQDNVFVLCASLFCVFASFYKKESGLGLLGIVVTLENSQNFTVRIKGLDQY